MLLVCFSLLVMSFNLATSVKLKDPLPPPPPPPPSEQLQPVTVTWESWCRVSQSCDDTNSANERQISNICARFFIHAAVVVLLLLVSLLFTEVLATAAVLTRAPGAVGVARSGSGPRGASCRWGWACGRWGRGGGHLVVGGEGAERRQAVSQSAAAMVGQPGIFPPPQNSSSILPLALLHSPVVRLKVVT